VTRIVAWFVHNSIAANLLMAVLVVGGFMTLISLRQEEFPSIDTQVVRVSVEHPGATPEEVEEAVCLRIEEAVEGTPGVERISSIAVEGVCVVTIELFTGTDTAWALSEIESKIDGITTFPAETEKPTVSYLVISDEVLDIAVWGAADERTLKVIGQELRDELAALPGVSQVTLGYVRPYEISIEVSEQALRRHGLTLDQVAATVRASSLDLPGGSLKTEGGEILLRSKGQAYRGSEFGSLIVLTRGDGTTVRLDEIAEVKDGFRDDDTRAFFDGEPAVIVSVTRVGDEDMLEVAAAVKERVEAFQSELPAGVELTIWSDHAESLRDRVRTLMGNALGGLAFVLVVLSLLLRFRLALWVAAGIPIALLGAIALFPVFDFAISTLAVMGFILVLGIVVDDAIVVGERVYAKEQELGPGPEAAVQGTTEVMVPVIFGVLTTVAAFAPLVLVPGRMGQFFGVLGGTVILCLLLSLVEAQLILPAHLAHRRSGPREPGRFARLQDAVAGGLDRLVTHHYRPALERVLEYRYAAIAAAVGMLVITASLFASGRMTFQFFPGVEGSRVFATMTLPNGVPIERTEAAVDRLEAAAAELGAELERAGEAGVIRHVLSSIGQQVGRNGPPDMSVATGGSHLAEVVLELSPSSTRDVTAKEVTRRWRELAGGIPDALELKFEAFSMHAGDPIAVQLSSNVVQRQRPAARRRRRPAKAARHL
jgi:multidrug efflux pump subunit AcrB